VSGGEQKGKSLKQQRFADAGDAVINEFHGKHDNDAQRFANAGDTVR
jgi:hypothetical protein